MISIFNGRTRGLGCDAKPDIYLQLSVALRQHLHHFKGSKLGVFMAIALHSDQDGWSKPSLALMRQETGYNKETISQAVTELCRVSINGARVLLAVQERLANGLLDVNRYLVFPTQEEVARFECEDARLLRKAREKQPCPGNMSSNEPRPEKPYSVEPDTAEPYTVNPEVSITRVKKNQFKEEPITTHTRREFALSDAGVGVRSNFTLEDCLAYANHLHRSGQGITNPGGFATAIRRSGEADTLISDYLNTRAGAERQQTGYTDCPDCRGTGYWYPGGVSKGVAKCQHVQLRAAPSRIG